MSAAPASPSPPPEPSLTTVTFLRYAIAVADYRSFRRAAEALHVSQPSLSESIGKWERHHGVEVFQRGSRGVTVTAIGEQVIAAARRALDAVLLVEDAVTSFAPPFYGPVRLGIIPTMGPELLPLVHAALEQVDREAVVPIIEARTDELCRQLADGRIDVVIMSPVPPVTDRFVMHELFVEPFLAALPRRHPLARRKQLDLVDLANDELLLLEQGHCLRDQVLDLCRHRRARAGVQYQASNLATLRQLVIAGRGITLMPALVARDDSHPEIRYRPLREAAERIVALFHRPDDHRADAYAMLLEPVRQLALTALG